MTMTMSIVVGVAVVLVDDFVVWYVGCTNTIQLEYRDADPRSGLLPKHIER